MRPEDRRPAVYLRVSTGRQEQEQTIDVQRYECQQKAGGGAAEYADDGYTGTTLHRPALDRLRADIRLGRINSVVMHAPDRLARKNPLGPVVLMEWKELGVEVAYCTYEVVDTPEGRMLGEFMGVFAEYEREVIMRRFRGGREARLRAELPWRSRPPFGYTYIKEGKGRIEVIQEQVPAVRQIFAWLLEGRSLYWVMDELNARGILNSVGSHWTYAPLHRLIRNPIYSGTVVHNRYTSTKVARPRVAYRKGVGGTAKERPAEEWLRFVPLAEDGSRALAIIDEETQARAIAQLSVNNRFAKRNAHYVYLLSGLLFCGKESIEGEGPCGRRLTGGTPRVRNGRTQRSYMCSRRTVKGHDGTTCRNHFDAQALEDLVWGFVVERLQDPARLKKELKLRLGEEGQERRDAERLAGQLDAALAKTKKGLARVVDLLIDDEVDRASVLARQAALLADRARLERDLVEARAALAEMSGPQTWDADAFVAQVSRTVAAVERAGEEDRRPLQQALLRQIFTRVVAYPDRLVMEGMLGGQRRVDYKSPTHVVDLQNIRLTWVLPLPSPKARARSAAAAPGAPTIAPRSRSIVPGPRRPLPTAAGWRLAVGGGS